MPNLLPEIISEIRANGPIAVDRYMEICNTHYYATRDPLGTGGDFITAPEISQIFGEMIGIWAITAWQKIGTPEKCALVELGPGRGTLMMDLLRAIKAVPEFKPEIHLVETSPVLIEVQEKQLKNYNVIWHKQLPQLDIPYILIANEFFDALPFKQFVNGEERKIIEDNGRLAFNYIAEDGMVREISPLGNEIAENIAKTAAAGIIIDYGYIVDLKKDTFQAMRNHQYHPLLKNPGEADLTAHVNFGELKAIFTRFSAKKCNILTQNEFLLAHGADVRAKILNKEKDLQRLIAHEQMGELFKVLCF